MIIEWSRWARVLVRKRGVSRAVITTRTYSAEERNCSFPAIITSWACQTFALSAFVVVCASLTRGGNCRADWAVVTGRANITDSFEGLAKEGSIRTRVVWVVVTIYIWLRQWYTWKNIWIKWSERNAILQDVNHSNILLRLYPGCSLLISIISDLGAIRNIYFFIFE